MFNLLDAKQKRNFESQWAKFWYRPWKNGHSTWKEVTHSVLDSNGITEALNYEILMNELGVSPSIEKEPDDVIEAMMIALDKDEEAIYHALVCGILTNGCMSSFLSDDLVVWCSRIYNALNLSQIKVHNEMIEVLFHPSFVHDKEAHKSIAAYAVMNVTGEHSGFWTRYKLRFAKDLHFPSVEDKVYVQKLHYIIMCALYFVQDEVEFQFVESEDTLNVPSDTELSNEATFA
ncbi:hypothetical protein CS022_13090 [Veronia nyctiphanis]|uniref:Uncharacterized protein n=1 Tax=Veronia nyctiphanis TaxID=1278244 RepID=A0A4Q0YPD6_9GAMM|nr:hypothetical protein [Veronia nyctiphanis]RXJ72796.1 hypothetical protein CS022_13090 [Veronia nyctiphanis]